MKNYLNKQEAINIFIEIMMNRPKLKVLWLITLLALPAVHALSNPAAVYCQEMGYEYQEVNTPQGKDGRCIIDSSNNFDAWDFFKGKVGKSFSYCAKLGLATETRSDGKSKFAKEYAVCVHDKLKASGLEFKVPVHGLIEGDKSITKSVSSKMSQPLTKLFGEEKLIRDPVEEDTSEPFNTIDISSGFDGLPSSFDWRSVNGSNWLTPIENQGYCGSCWAFSAVGAIEPSIKLERNDSSFSIDLSEQELVSCDGNSAGCSGGLSYYSLNDYAVNAGIADEDCYPDTSSSTGITGTCGAGVCGEWIEHSWYLNNAVAMGAYPNNDDVKQALINYGPLSIAYYHNGSFDGDIYRCDESDPYYHLNAGHAVVLVGFDDSEQAWLIRNSWGTGYQDGGYFKIGYGECEIFKGFGPIIPDYSDIVCNNTLACSAGPGDDNYNSGGDYACLGYKDGLSNCDYADSCQYLPSCTTGDLDGDGVADISDNCPTTSNPGQENNDGDSEGDACDPDDDNDGILDVSDDCNLTWGLAYYNGCPDIYPPQFNVNLPSQPLTSTVLLEWNVSDYCDMNGKVSINYTLPGHAPVELVNGLDANDSYAWDTSMLDTNFLNLSFIAEDDYNNLQENTYVDLEVDNTEPWFAISGPTGGEIVGKSFNFTFTPYDSVSDYLSCNISISDGSLITANWLTAGSEVNLTMDVLSNGDYTWNLTCVDEAGHVNVSSNHAFTMMNLEPVIIFNNPLNQAYAINPGHLNLSITSPISTIIDAYINVSFPWDAYDNQTMVLINDGDYWYNDTYEFLNNTLYEFTAYAIDAETRNTTEVSYFLIDNASPEVMIQVLNINTTEDYNDIFFNVTDNLISTVDCTLYKDGVQWYSGIFNTTGQSNFSTYLEEDGVYDWWINCSDYVYETASEVGSIIKDALPPNITINSLNGVTIGVNDYDLNVTVVDPHSGVKVVYATYNSVSQGYQTLNLTKNGDVYYNDTYLYPENEQLTVWVHAIDNFGNIESKKIIFYVDTLAPELSLVNGTDLNTTNSLLTAYFNVSENSGSTVYCSLLINGEIVNNTQMIEGDYRSLSYNLTTNGVYEWRVNCTDGFAGHDNETEAHTIIYDNTPPLLVYQSLDDNLYGPQILVNASAYDELNKVDTLKYKLNGGGYDSGYIEFTGPTYHNLDSAVYQLLWVANDTLGNEWSWPDYFQVDNDSPIIDINSPLNQTYESDVILSVSYSDEANVTCNYSLDGGPAISFDCDKNINLGNFTDYSTHSISVLATDSWGLVNETEAIYFTMDYDLPPVIELINPTSNVNLTSNLFTVEFNATDKSEPSLACELLINNQVVNSTTIDTSIINSLSYSLPSDGVYDYQINCSEATHVVGSTIYEAILDTTAPVINITSPDTTTIYGQIVLVNASFTDALIGFDQATYNLDLTGNQPYSEPFNLTGLSHGNHTIEFTTTDWLGNSDSDSITFFVDAEAPNASFITPINDTYETNTVPLTLSYSDDSPVSCEYTLDNASLVIFDCDATVNLGPFNDVSTHYVNASITDAYGYITSLDKVYFTVDYNQAPVFTATGSSTYTINENETLTIDFEASDPDGDSYTFSDDSTLFDIDSTTGLINWTSTYTSAGTYTVIVYVSDGSLKSSTAFDLTINDNGWCGNGVCDAGEQCDICTIDCGSCQPDEPDPSGPITEYVLDDPDPEPIDEPEIGLEVEVIEDNMTNISAQLSDLSELQSINLSSINDLLFTVNQSINLLNDNSTSNKSSVLNSTKALMANLSAIMPELELVVDEEVDPVEVNEHDLMILSNNSITAVVPVNNELISGQVSVKAHKKVVKVKDKVSNTELNVSVVTKEIVNEGNESLTNFSLIEVIPKSIALSVSELSFKESARLVVIEDDPVVAWVFDELAPGESVNVGYEVKKDISTITEPSTYKVLSAPVTAKKVIEPVPEKNYENPITGYDVISVDSNEYIGSRLTTYLELGLAILITGLIFLSRRRKA